MEIRKQKRTKSSMETDNKTDNKTRVQNRCIAAESDS